MATQVSDNVRALFVDLGIAAEKIGETNVLVIDRFDHWADRRGSLLSPTICSTVSGDVIVGAA